MTGITAKTFYSIKIIFELSKNYKKGILQISDIQKNTKIPKSILIQILNKLKNLKLINSYRGTKGGYELNKEPTNISLLEIIENFEGGFNLFTHYKNNDSIKKILEESLIKIKKTLNVSFAQLLINQAKIDKNFMYYI